MKELVLTKKAGVFSALLFSAAIAVLLTARFGPLTLPGVVAAALGALFSLAGLDVFAAAVGVLSASVSFSAQALVGVCGSCTFAAACFAVAGLVSVARVGKNKPVIAVFLMLPLITGLLLYNYRLDVSNDLKNSKTAETETASATIVQGEAGRPDVPVLYFSPWCEYCEEPLREFVEKDPEGRAWQPVVIPSSALNKGEEMLKEMGYTGKLVSAPASPSSEIPCLQMPDGRLLVGQQKIIRVLKGERS